MAVLKVFRLQQQVGTITADDEGRFGFAYEQSWLSNPDRFAISQSLPLGPRPIAAGAGHAYFANLLPEGRVRTLVARRLGLSEGNDFALLSAIGGECAGALVIGKGPPAADENRYRPIDEAELNRLASTGAAFAETSGRAGVRLSLAGAQDKLPVWVDEDRLMLPLGSSPSSHILKFASRDYKHMPGNESLITALAAASGLPVVKAMLRKVGRQTHLLVERYDRVASDGGRLIRLHQEDLCQALGVPPGRKYQEEGGPTFEQCFRLVANCSSEPALDARALVRWLVFNAIVGNADGHAKNLSLLRSADGKLRLAPFYDLLSTAAYSAVATRLAMTIGGNTDPGKISGADWRQLAGTIDVRAAFVIDTVRELAESMPDRARTVAAELTSRNGVSPAADMIFPGLRKRARRIAQQLAK